MAQFADAATNIVTATADNVPGSLRQIVSNSVSGDTIIFAPNLAGATIQLGYTLNVNISLNFDASALPGGIRISGGGTNSNSSGSVFRMGAGTTNVMTALTITNGYATYWDYLGDGGGVRNYGNLTLNRCTVVGNISRPYAPGSRFEPHGNGGGGLANEAGGTMTVNQCTIAGNMVYPYNTNPNYGAGAGIFNAGTLIVNGSTLSGNGSPECNAGGAIYGGTNTFVNQCTLSGNSAISGGGMAGLGMINQSTVSGNTAVSSGAALMGTFIVSNSVAAGNTRPYSATSDISGTLTNSANNVIDVSPNLSPLGNYGGLTATMPPLPGSPAIDNGSDTATNVFGTDQRGSPRFSGLHVDAGAVESAFPAAAPLAVTSPATGLGFALATLNATVTPMGRSRRVTSNTAPRQITGSPPPM